MGILSRLFRRAAKVDALIPLDRDKGSYVLNRAVSTKFRRAQAVPEPLRERLVEVCANDTAVAACCLLDVIEPATGDIKLFVSLTLDCPEDLHRVGPAMQAVFRDFPQYTCNYFIGQDLFGELDPAFAVYTRVT